MCVCVCVWGVQAVIIMPGGPACCLWFCDANALPTGGGGCSTCVRRDAVKQRNVPQCIVPALQHPFFYSFPYLGHTAMHAATFPDKFPQRVSLTGADSNLQRMTHSRPNTASIKIHNGMGGSTQNLFYLLYFCFYKKHKYGTLLIIIVYNLFLFFLIVILKKAAVTFAQATFYILFLPQYVKACPL